MTKPCHRAIVKLCLLTGQRVGEVAGLARSELDMKAGVWTIPAARSKNKTAHSVPLSGAALAVIKEHLLDEEKLFPDAGNTDVIGKAVERALPEFGIAHWTLHDLRRTAVTGMAELGVSPIVLGHVINHRSVTKAGVTLAVYSHYDYAKEKREALELWADRLSAIVTGGGAQVIPMNASGVA
jgi:integrase